MKIPNGQVCPKCPTTEAFPTYIYSNINQFRQAGILGSLWLLLECFVENLCLGGVLVLLCTFDVHMHYGLQAAGSQKVSLMLSVKVSRYLTRSQCSLQLHRSHFLYESWWVHFDQSFTEICLLGPINNTSVLVQIMSFRKHDKPLSDPIMTWLIIAYMRHSASMSWMEQQPLGNHPHQRVFCN